MPPFCNLIFWLGLCSTLQLVVTQPSPPLTVVHVPLTASSDNQRYFANVNMSHGPQTQHFGFALSTTTGYTIVAADSCASCASSDIPTYNSTLSNSAKAIDSGQQQQSVHIAGGTVNAGLGIASKEDCALHQANGSFWQYPNQTIIQANSSAVFQAGVSGLIGLGTNTANFGDTIFSGWLSNNPTLPNFTFGLALNPLPGTQAQVPASSSGGDPNDANASAGTLHMQQPDPSSYTGDIQWQDVQNISPATNESASGLSTSNLGDSSWLIQMDGWKFTTAGTQTSNSQAALAAVEPFFPNLFLPKAHANQLYATLPGSQLLTPESSDVVQSYSIPCDADITFTVILSGQGYLLPKEALVIKGADGSCAGAIEGWTDDSATNYLLGSRFISTVYMVFQIGQLPAAQQQVGIAQRAQVNNPKKKLVGAIVGGVVGGVAFLLVVGGAVYWWIKRRTRFTVTNAVRDETGRSDVAKEKVGLGLPGHTIHHWAPPSVSYSGTTPELYYLPISAPTANSSPISPATHETDFSAMNSLPGTATSEAFLLPQPPRVKQWVTGLNSTSASHSATHAVPAEYDYGNRGEPGMFVSSNSSEGEGNGSGIPEPVGHDTHASLM